MTEKLKKRQIFFKLISILGFIAVAYGGILYFIDSADKTTAVELIILGFFTVILVLVVGPILDPVSAKGVKRQKKIQQKNVSKFAKNKDATIIVHAFDKYIQHYPEAMKNYPERVPVSVEYANRDNEFITIIYKGREYVFYFKILENPVDNSNTPRSARLQLYKNSRRRLDIILKEKINNRHLPYWQPESVRYLDYGYGTWTKDMKNLIKDARKIARYYIWNS